MSKLLELARMVVSSQPVDGHLGHCIFCDAWLGNEHLDFRDGNPHADDCAWFLLKQKVDESEVHHV